VISTAIKKGKAEQRWIDAAVSSMTTLNKSAADVIAAGNFTVHAMTDITGFGLIGHAREMMLASNVSIKISASSIPVLDGAFECIRAGHIPGGLNNNRDFAECLLQYDESISDEIRTLLYDPQTAGGLLISTPQGPALMQAMKAAGIRAAHIGEVHPHSKPLISISR
jgi:selenide,water dikinase